MSAPVLPAGLPGRPAPGLAVPVGAAAVAALASGVLAAVEPVSSLVLLGAVAALAVVVLVAVRPVLAVPLYLAVMPFVAGIDRGVLLPLVRPNEALLVLVTTGACLGGLTRRVRGDASPWRSHPLDGPLLAFALLSTVWPILSLLLRGAEPTGAELAALLPTIKLTGLFLLTRLTLTGVEDVERALRIVARTAAGVALIAVLQTLQVPPVVDALSAVWPVTDAAEDVAERGTTTLASPIATGDVVLIGLVVVVCCAARGLLGRREGRVLAAVLVAGVLAAGQFSTWIAAAVVAGLLLWRFPRLRGLVRRFSPWLLVIAALGAPAVVGRLAGFGDGLGAPVSWLTRWDNLATFYLPVFEPLTVLVGVSPDSVVAAPETWRDLVYLEAGYLDLLWIGGVPLLAGFAWLSVVVLRSCRRAGVARNAHGAAAQALEIVWWYLLVLTVVDPHLTTRGTGDLVAVLLALVAGRAVARPPAVPTPSAPRAAASSRPLDLALGAPALLLLAPLLGALAVAVRATSPGPAFFRQERVGRDGQRFTMVKLRTMAADGPGDGDAALRDLVAAELRGEDTSNDGSCKLATDPRVTPLGAWLRRTSLDELPQLWNVVRGDMALVGPRPCLPWEAAMFPSRYQVRFRVRPGLTGLWQVSGRSTLGTLEMLELDRRYVADRGPVGDVAILARTVPALLRRDGAR